MCGVAFCFVSSCSKLNAQLVPCGAQLKHLRFDHRFMTQITSSAIWNGPSPEGYVSMLNRTNTAAHVSQRTQEKLLRIFAARLCPAL